MAKVFQYQITKIFHSYKWISFANLIFAIAGKMNTDRIKCFHDELKLLT